MREESLGGDDGRVEALEGADLEDATVAGCQIDEAGVFADRGGGGRQPR